MLFSFCFRIKFSCDPLHSRSNKGLWNFLRNFENYFFSLVNFPKKSKDGRHENHLPKALHVTPWEPNQKPETEKKNTDLNVNFTILLYGIHPHLMTQFWRWKSEFLAINLNRLKGGVGGQIHTLGKSILLERPNQFF